MAKRTLLTNLELELMRVIWSADANALTVREVTDLYTRRSKKPLAYTTIQTMLTILEKKKVVRVKKGSGRAHLYVARKTRDEVTTSMVDDLVDRLFDGRVEPLLVHLLDKEEVSREELQDLKRFIETRLHDGEDES
ncbi:MAG TPA: BlaI/MecI/CopY family transcriptional regulator [Planctomycetes bacterium]|nr:BlaI/MecI/CopY family transcriptional regulator [Planctomycetota bacterium]